MTNVHDARTPHAILYGGGFDSTALAILLHNAGRRIVLLHVDYGQAAADVEWHHSTRLLAQRLKVAAHQVTVALPGLTGSILKGSNQVADSQASAKLDARNFMLLGVVSPLAVSLGCASIYLGFHEVAADCPMPDITPAFIDAANVFVAQAVTHPLRIRSPLCRVPREDAITSAASVAPYLFDVAHTCYSSTPGGCGVCLHCVRAASLRTLPTRMATNVEQAIAADVSAVAVTNGCMT